MGMGRVLAHVHIPLWKSKLASSVLAEGAPCLFFIPQKGAKAFA